MYLQTASGNVEYVTSRNGVDPFGRNWLNIAPHFIHLLPVDTSCAGNELRGIDQMWCAIAMHIDRGFWHATE